MIVAEWEAYMAELAAEHGRPLTPAAQRRRVAKCLGGLGGKVIALVPMGIGNGAPCGVVGWRSATGYGIVERYQLTDQGDWLHGMESVEAEQDEQLRERTEARAQQLREEDAR